MLVQLILFELKAAFRNKVTYIYFLIMFSLAFLFINALGGAFPSLQIQIAGDNIKLNSPTVIDLVLSIFSFLGIFITAGVVSNIIYKDFKYNSQSLTFATQVSKFNYLFGRFIAALLINIFIFIGPALGILIGSEMPYLNSSMFGEVIPMAYVNTYLTRIIPNLFFVISIFFTLTLLLRNIIVNWFVIIGLYVLYAVGGRLINDLDNQTLASLIDPFGMASSMKVSANYSTEEANTKSIPLESVYLLNRLLWTGIGLITILFGYFRFQFSFDIERLFRKNKKNVLAKASNTQAHYSHQIVSSNTDFGKNYTWAVFYSMLKKEFKGLISNIYFKLILLVGIGFLLMTSQAIGKIFDTDTYPVTYQVIGILGGTFNLFVMIIIILFSGEMVWQSRQLKSHEIDGVLPVFNWQILGSKILALASAVFLTLLVLIVCGIGVQAYRGYYEFEIGLYIQSVLGLQFSSYLLVILLAFFVQILVNHKFLAYSIMIIYYIWDAQFATAVLQNNLFIYNSAPSYMYSDMNGFSEGMWVVLLYRFYWLGFAIALGIISHQFIVRGTEEAFAKRWQNFKQDWPVTRKAILPFLVVFLGLGGYIFYNTHILNEYQTSYQMEKESVEYEKLYKKYEARKQPRIVASDVKFDLYPESGNANIEGNYTLKNKTNKAIDTLILSVDRKKVSSIEIEDGYKAILEDHKHDFHMYKLNKSLLPGDSVLMSFSYQHEVKGFTNQGVEVLSHKNGSFINSSILPSFGYESSRELSRRKLREKHGLPEKRIEKEREDPLAVQNNFITDDADFVKLKVQVSTSEDQIALAPGYCTRQWARDGRNYYEYVSDVPLIHYYAVLSARYEVIEDKWIPNDTSMQPVDIKVFYHKGHEYNIDNIISGVKSSLDYYTKEYCEYPHPEMKIVEFPRYASFAQSFPAMIPFSEGLGFIADLRDLEEPDTDFADLKIDYPLWVTAHEMAHQWLAHHLIAGDAEGAQMLMESLTQFSSLKVIEDSFGKEKMRKFLRQEMNRYLMSRQNEAFEEQALATVWGHQQDIYYQKGIIVLNAINDYLGEDKLVQLTSEFINDRKFKGAPYLTTIDFVEELKTITPDSLQYLIEDGLEKITFYDFEITNAKYERNEEMEYFLHLDIEAEKLYADGLGKETEAKMNDFVEVGVFKKNGKEVYLEKLKLTSGENHFKIKLGRKPSKVIIDPDYKLISKKMERAEIKVEKLKT